MTSEEIQAIFYVECEESLAAAEAGLAACKDGTQDADTVNGIFRAVHSIKGGAGAFGYAALQAYTHCFETLLSDVRDGTLAIGNPLIDLLLRALDTLTDHVSTVREGGTPPEDAALIAEMTAAQAGSQADAPVASSAVSQVKAVAQVPAEPSAVPDADFGLDFDSMLDDIVGTFAPQAASSWRVQLRPHAAAMRNGGEPLLLLRELEGLGAECMACDSLAIPPLDAIDPHQGYLGWTFALPAHVEQSVVSDIFDFSEDDWGIAFGDDAHVPPPLIGARSDPATEPLPEPLAVATPSDQAPVAIEAAPSDASPPPAAAPATTAAGQSIRIELSKLDQLIDSVGEMVIAQAMMAQRLEGAGVAASEELAALEGLTRDIQESAMSIRAQPIGSVFSRVPRTLRELAASTGKQVRLVVSGEATELDKTVIERLGEPLIHLIRNAVDHGIESPEERLAAGKSAEGTLTLSAEHRSGRIVIRIADDGKGIDRTRVFAKAVEKGLVSADAQLSKEDIDLLIFAPGFSTAATVSNVSGRGVGMDVVRQNVKELGGRITIESESGSGTAFTLTLPLTLAIADGMIVNVGDQTLVVPLTHIVESLRPERAEVQGLGTRREMLNVRGRFIPVVRVCQAIGASNCFTAPEEGVLIVVDTVAGPAALLVDDICDQRQFVIKNLDTHYRAVEGVAGATILGDGRVALILDVDGLVASAIAAPNRIAA
jgi:two-component system chemotaxis sensor kinase CheA